MSPKTRNASPRWSGEDVLRRTALFWVGLACTLVLAAHVMASAQRLLPANAIIVLIGVVSLGSAVFVCYLNILLRRTLACSLLHALRVISAKPSDERFREEQFRLHQQMRAWWLAVPLGLRWLTLPATCYLAWSTFAYFSDEGNLNLFGNDFRGLRMYSAVWLATSLPMLAFIGFSSDRPLGMSRSEP